MAKLVHSTARMPPYVKDLWHFCLLSGPHPEEPASVAAPPRPGEPAKRASPRALLRMRAGVSTGAGPVEDQRLSPGQVRQDAAADLGRVLAAAVGQDDDADLPIRQHADVARRVVEAGVLLDDGRREMVIDLPGHGLG